MFTSGGIVGLAKGIIDDTCLVFFRLQELEACLETSSLITLADERMWI